jgi:hypothetical protein
MPPSCQSKAILLISLLILPYTIHAADPWAMSEFVAALDACDRGLTMSPPKSQGSLDILQMLLSKYQMSSNDALEKDSSLKSLSSTYNGDSLKSLTFAEAYHRCETQLFDKVKRADSEVKQRIDLRQRRFVEQQPAVEKLLLQMQQAEIHAITAIEQGCSNLQVTAENAPSLFSQYTAEKQQALQLYPEIGQRLAPTQSQPAETKVKVIKNIAYWFKECDALFARLLPPPTVIAPPPPKSPQLSLLPPDIALPYVTESPIVAIIPHAELVPTPLCFPITADDNVIPHSLTMTSLNASDPPSVVAPEAEIKVQPEAEVVAPTDSPALSEPEVATAENIYQEWLTKMQGDRLKVLQSEKRLPDTTDHDLDYPKATRWQYQKTTTSGRDKCVIYSFANNKLTRTKETNGQCAQ